MTIEISKRGRRARLATALAVSLVAVLTLPALAVDTGGGGGKPSGGGGSSGSSGSGGSSSSSGSSGSSSHGSSSSNSAGAMTPMGTTAAPTIKYVDLNDARRLIARQDWTGAIKLLRVIVVQQPKNADAMNLLGYSLRNSGQMAEAETWYLKALKIQPTHLGANEYLGELYVMTGQMTKAKARLAEIAKICGNTSCEEYADLYKAITAKA